MASKSKSNGLESSWARAPPPNRPFCERALRAIYDPEEKTFLGRTPKRWGIVFAFYAVFYAVLALMFALCMAGLFSVIDDRKPTFILESSLIGANPGVAARPRAIVLNTLNSSLIEEYVHELEEFLKPYTNEAWVSSKEKCTKEDNYGYPESPCFFLKLNQIYGWKPDFFAAADLPVEMPEDLTQFINDLPEIERQQIWISCWDERNNATQIDYPWGRGLPGRFYPFLNQDDYIRPLLAIKVTPPTNLMVAIRCRAWARNIVYNKSIKEPSGYVRVLMLITDTSATNTTDPVE
ncbi:sodium/potassium-transporting ATPase subunit beta-1-like isoform X2 [Maniola hyperantus]|uniref:sodium/potassium-transporting ATPase subunit beta-1-like isoform X1 n=1 Tax=Aphantopus hyperantus TaxID=2795564 RepID=UPI001568B133|nr:sodium/potassium-transporting ATPase subunit beta-1-like [Maniola hyperantus]